MQRPASQETCRRSTNSHIRRWGGERSRMQETIASIGHVGARPSAGIRVVCAAAFAIGAVLVFTVGFAQSEVLHNAAHDTRHSLAFPCH